MQEYVNRLNVLYEDNHVIVVEKFQNILSQKDITDDFSMLEIIKEYIKVKENKPGNVFLGLVHRLDRRVGGLMVFAKTSKAASRLSEQIRHSAVKRKYLVCVQGEINKNEGELIDYLIKDEKNRRAIISTQNSPNSQKAILKYRLLKKYQENNMSYSYLEVDLITGRYNQIRAQFSNIKHPLVGDTKYGARPNNSIGLWCHYLSFAHPTTKEELQFTLFPTGGVWDSLI